MKRFLFGALLGATVYCTIPKAQAEMIAWATAAGDSVKVTGYWHNPVSDGNGPIDSVTIRAGYTGGVEQRFKIPIGSTQASVSFLKLAAGTTYSGGYFCRAYWRGGLRTEDCKPWTFTVPIVAPPGSPLDSVTVVGLVISPTSATAEAITTATPTAKNQVQFCGFVRFATGQAGLTPAQAGIPACQQAYALLPADVRAITSAQQQVLNTLNIQWSVSG